MDVGLPIYFTQLEQIFDSCEAYPVKELLEHCSLSSAGGVYRPSREGIPQDDHSDVHSEVEHEARGRNQSPSLEESSADVVPSLSVCEGDQQKTQLSPETREVVTSTASAVKTEVDHSSPIPSDEVYFKLLSSFEKRDVATEKKLKELFEAAQSNTAKESLLLSLR